MTYFLDRVDAVPVINTDIDIQLLQWIWVLVDTLNENLNDIQNALNLLTAQNYTASQINAMQIAVPSQISNGVLLYDTTNNVYVGKISGSLVKLTTTAYP